MCVHELVALCRFSGNNCKCKTCKAILNRYEKMLPLTANELGHLKKCVYE